MSPGQTDITEKRKMGEERCKAIKEEVDKLLNANFIKKVRYST